MVIWMIHPNNGKHPALPFEVEEMKKNGWSIYEKPTKLVEVEKQEEVLMQEVQSNVKKRGRPAKG